MNYIDLSTAILNLVLLSNHYLKIIVKETTVILSFVAILTMWLNFIYGQQVMVKLAFGNQVQHSPSTIITFSFFTDRVSFLCFKFFLNEAFCHLTGL